MKTENIIIRPETPQDHRETENVVREAFWDIYRPGCSEHLILHKIRTAPAFINELDLVACDGNKIVGAVICPKGKIKNEQDQEFIALSMMVGVLPSYQGKGVGSMLIKQAIKIARSLGYKGIVIFGNPEYYPRFGFKNAKEYGIQTSDGQNFDPFMALEISENSLNGIQGRFYEDPIFQPSSDNAELEAFDKQFPHKEKHVTDTQLK
jgi:predicted N-acetyltransferase YhbS